VEVSLENLWRRVKAGDSRAWEELVVKFTPLLLAVSRRNGLNQIDAEDCTQYVWYSLYRSRHNVNDPNRLPAWLIRVAARRSGQIIRRGIKEVQRLTHMGKPEAPGLADEDLLRFERAAMVKLALERIDPRCRKLLESLFYSPGEMTYEEIADELNIPVNSMGPTRARCLEKLRRLLEEMGY